VDFALTPGQRELRARAAAFVDEVLIPLELTAELAGGRLSEADRRHVRDQARERGLDSGNHAVELGGRGWDNVEQVLVQEELGRNTNAIWWNMAETNACERSPRKSALNLHRRFVSESWERWPVSPPRARYRTIAR
jgi:alkylation response protein AidB-like acyl-CoA dehydrogenase